jgi:hypothetical protein
MPGPFTLASPRLDPLTENTTDNAPATNTSGSCAVLGGEGLAGKRLDLVLCNIVFFGKMCILDGNSHRRLLCLPSTTFSLPKMNAPSLIP